MLAKQEALDGRSSGWGGFGVSTERSGSREGSPSRQSEGIKVVNLSEHALAASDFAEELKSGRRALESINVNVDNSMKNGRTPAFVGQTAFVMKDGRPKLVDRSQDSVMSPERSLALDAQRALQGFLTWVDGAPPPPRPREPTACERMLPELGEDGVMWYLLQLSQGSDRWVIQRRYSEWHALREQLSLGPFRDGLGAHLPFPEKRLLWSLCNPGGRHDPSLISQRTAGLHQWASALLAIDGAVEHEQVARFFELDPRAQRAALPA